ncbi:hypothetical protein DFH08DRAFT_819798 [Mycena albidolilacea]|uniref:Uncharacterized protein n=1 Tax=Mycena albidolilacea TaxID=1033008 RepID=A0AAD7EF68_9AGAR|nr:hypothetical protein DFH08DRAFT_819798 [Mycena albidolilacea]
MYTTSNIQVVLKIPVFSALRNTFSSVGVTYEFSRYAPGDEVWPVVADHWIIADCAFTILLILPGFMAYRLWRTDRIIRPLGGPTIMSVLRIIIESTALSAGWCIFFIAAYSAQSNLRFLVDITPSVVGALNMLVYMRTGMGWNRAQESDLAKQLVEICGTTLAEKHIEVGNTHQEPTQSNDRQEETVENVKLSTDVLITAGQVESPSLLRDKKNFLSNQYADSRTRHARGDLRRLWTRPMGRDGGNARNRAEGTRTGEKCRQVLVRGVQRAEEVALDMEVGHERERARLGWKATQSDVKTGAVWWEGSGGREAGERDSVGLLVNHLRMRERVRAEPRHPAACCRDFGKSRSRALPHPSARLLSVPAYPSFRTSVSGDAPDTDSVTFVPRFTFAILTFCLVGWREGHLFSCIYIMYCQILFRKVGWSSVFGGVFHALLVMSAARNLLVVGAIRCKWHPAGSFHLSVGIFVTRTVITRSYRTPSSHILHLTLTRAGLTTAFLRTPALFHIPRKPHPYPWYSRGVRVRLDHLLLSGAVQSASGSQDQVERVSERRVCGQPELF